MYSSGQTIEPEQDSCRANDEHPCGAEAKGQTPRKEDVDRALRCLLTRASTAASAGLSGTSPAALLLHLGQREFNGARTTPRAPRRRKVTSDGAARKTLKSNTDRSDGYRSELGREIGTAYRLEDTSGAAGQRASTRPRARGACTRFDYTISKPRRPVAARRREETRSRRRCQCAP
ncbi:hypothetical protein M885DRAFT_527224 [Pelagophyceae sp. CCMP2097]|nr:hypothetical protein M885DRAFT_527224 [Pelagophyceae sp. CCMP2097]